MQIILLSDPVSDVYAGHRFPFRKKKYRAELKPPSTIAVPMDIGETHHNKNKGSGGECSPTHLREPDTVCRTSRLIDSGDPVAKQVFRSESSQKQRLRAFRR
uniref:(northern house mosquito) hypothetical protein n=1 Tax=Culex pipiens TaxID=7175 RepID=A0A8D8BBJ2_CULPI